MNSQSKSYEISWLALCIFLVLSMILIGGYTRLSGSGLSIVEWQLVEGILPPLTSKAWIIEFKKYTLSPEYKYINFSMKIDEFKKIFLVEYAHRLLARLTGIIYIIPMIYYSFLKKTLVQYKLRLVMVALLISMQGVIGWYMVKSGLIDKPNVSQYRLALHLFVATIIIGLIFWTILDLLYSTKRTNYYICKTVKIQSLVNLYLVLIQIIIGALVAGLDAGLVYNNFPLMGNSLIPPDIFLLHPWYLNFFENPSSVQFLHRIIAYCLFISIILTHIKMTKLDSNLQQLSFYVLVMAIIQLILGIFTLLSNVELLIALTHQICAIVLYLLLLYFYYFASRR